MVMAEYGGGGEGEWRGLLEENFNILMDWSNRQPTVGDFVYPYIQKDGIIYKQ